MSNTNNADLLTETEAALLGAIKKFVDRTDPNPTSIEHLANAYALIAGTAQTAPGAPRRATVLPN
jgi:hypothetical protein